MKTSSQPGYQIWHLTDLARSRETDVLHAIYPAYPNGTNCDYCKLFYAVKQAGQPWKTFPKASDGAGQGRQLG